MPLTVKDALRLATKDKAFANELISNPEGLKAHFNLTDAQITHLKAIGSAALKAKTVLGTVGHGGIGPQADYD